VSWRHVRGHDELIAAFGRAVARGRLAHAYLFVGPAGVGKRLFARQLAKTLLCESPPAGRWDSCDACPACALVDAGTHPDLFAVARPADKLEMPIEVIRELCDGLAFKPARGGRKIAIVDDADDLNEESANSFLKTLEEPPPGSLLILIGTSADRQLPTIRSRCQVIPFAPLSDERVEELLHADADFESADISRLARISGGSPGMARELADPKLWAFRTQVLQELARPKPDVPKLFREWKILVDEAGSDAGSQRRRASLVLQLLIDGFRDALRVATSGPARSASEGTKLAERFGEDELLKRLERCLEADFQIDRRVQLVLVLDALLAALV
jgi:DNA polymerase-3 subunit delta'